MCAKEEVDRLIKNRFDFKASGDVS